MTDSTLKKIAKECLLTALFFFPLQDKSKLLYWALSDNNSLCDRKLYMNLGYWKNASGCLDEAGDQLAHLVGETARMDHDDHVLDAGSGFGDQAIYWMKEFDPKKIVGVNISTHQITSAFHRIKMCGLQKEVSFIKADATHIPVGNAEFDVVTSLEAPFHFKTRDDFFTEAFRILKPGGRMALTDLTLSSMPVAVKERLMHFFGCNFWQIPKENRYTVSVYKEKLKNAGFSNIKIDSIWNDVYPPWKKFAADRIHSEAVRKRFSFIFRRFLAWSVRSQNREKLMDYIVVYAEKPLTGSRHLKGVT